MLFGYCCTELVWICFSVYLLHLTVRYLLKLNDLWFLPRSFNIKVEELHFFFKYTMISSSLVKKCKINSFRPLFQRALRRFKYNGIIRCAGVCADSMSVMSNRASAGAVCLPCIAGTKHDAVVWRLWFVWFVKCDDDDDDEESNESIC